jgi:hypothetical protein
VSEDCLPNDRVVRSMDSVAPKVGAMHSAVADYRADINYLSYCVCACVRACACVCVCGRVRVWVCACIRAYHC